MQTQQVGPAPKNKNILVVVNYNLKKRTNKGLEIKTI